MPVMRARIGNDLKRRRFLGRDHRAVAVGDVHGNANDLKIVRPPVLMNEIPWYQMNMDKVVCYCMNITNRMIKDAVEKGAKTLEDVQEQTGASTVCGACLEDVQAG